MQEGIISLFTLIYNPDKTNYKIINPLIHNLKLANVGLNQIPDPPHRSSKVYVTVVVLAIRYYPNNMEPIDGPTRSKLCLWPCTRCV